MLSFVRTVLVFDNWRVLHGRSAFSGRREMCGGYSVFLSCPIRIEYADFNSQYGRLHLKVEDVEFFTERNSKQRVALPDRG